MIEAKRLAPEVMIFWDRGPDTDIDADIQFAIEHGFDSLVIHHRGLTAEKIQKIKAAGLEVGAWTVNDPNHLTNLLQMGVERIYTDEPRTLLKLKSANGQDRFDKEVLCEGRYPKHLQGRFEFDCSLGIVGLPSSKLLVASGQCTAELGCSGTVRTAQPDSTYGLSSPPRFLR